MVPNVLLIRCHASKIRAPELLIVDSRGYMWPLDGGMTAVLFEISVWKRFLPIAQKIPIFNSDMFVAVGYKLNL